MTLTRYALLISIPLYLLSFFPGESFSKNPDKTAPADKNSTSSGILTLRPNQQISLNDLIAQSGYSIDDKDVASFLRDFSMMNDDIKSVSSIKKGTTVRLPLKYLSKGGSISSRAGERARIQATKSRITKTKEKTVSDERSELLLVKKKILKRQEKEETAGETDVLRRAVLLRNIKALSHALQDKFQLSTDGFRVLTLNERSEMSLDTSFFPVIDMNQERVVVLDYSGILPEEISDVIELAWPEYRVVSNRGKFDLKEIVYSLLESMGYSINRDKSIIAGNKTQIEYLTDFVILRKDSDPLSEDMTGISFIGSGAYATPEVLLDWLRRRDINIVELSYDENKKYHRGKAQVNALSPERDSRQFTENVLAILGYPFAKDTQVNLSERKEFTYKLRADLSIDMGRKTKLIEFAELSDNEIKYARKRGFDVVCIMSWEERKEVLSKIFSLLSLNYANSPKTTVHKITPEGVKYRLLSTGLFVHSIQGKFFLTDSDFDPELLRQVVNQDITIVTF